MLAVGESSGALLLFEAKPASKPAATQKGDGPLLLC